jgi:hypothetical protein
LKRINDLRDRGVQLASPASSQDLLELRACVSSEAFELLCQSIYRSFDGFENDDFDDLSFLRIWPIRRIVGSKFLSGKFVPFLDFSLDSEIYGLIEGCGPLIFSTRGELKRCITVELLLDAIVEGAYDGSLGLE